MEKFETLNATELVTVVGGRNGWAENVTGAAGGAIGGAVLGTAICGPACGFVGAHYGAILWTGVTAATGGFGSIHKKRRGK